MALILCPHCGKKISDLASMCPHCGGSVAVDLVELESKEVPEECTGLVQIKNTDKKSIRMKKVIAISAIVILLMGGIFFVTNRLSPEEKYQVEAVMNQIDAIGEVQLYSGDAIEKAEEQYELLSSKCKRKVENKNELKKAKTKWNELEAKNVSEQIESIGEVQIGTEIKLQFAKTAYSKLTDEQKKLVKNSDKIAQAEEKLSTLRVENVEELISDIGEVKADKDTRDKITKAEQAYDATLTDEEKKQVKNYDILISLKSQYGELAVQNCITAIDAIGEVTLNSSDSVHAATEAYLLVLSGDKAKVTNNEKLDEATMKLVELQKAEEERQRTLNAGDTFTTADWEVTFKKARVSAKILPNSTYGYYHYYYADDDSVYVDLVFNVENINSDRLSLSNVVSNARVEYGGKYNYTDYSTFYSSGNDIDIVYSWDGLDALRSTTLHVAVKLPRVAQISGESIKATVTIAGKEKLIKVR